MNKLEYIISLIFTLIFRFIRIFPNNDPIMGFILPEGRKSMLKSASFAFIAMFIFDFFTSGIGIWTIVIASVYALIALVFSFFFKKIKKAKISQYALAATIGIIAFDIITGPIMSSLIFKMPFWISVIGQVPFTFYHLVSGLTYVIILAPVFDLDIRVQYIDYKNQIINSIITLTNLLGFFK